MRVSYAEETLDGLALIARHAQLFPAFHHDDVLP
jgi:hypothetical protein